MATIMNNLWKKHVIENGDYDYYDGEDDMYMAERTEMFRLPDGFTAQQSIEASLVLVGGDYDDDDGFIHDEA